MINKLKFFIDKVLKRKGIDNALKLLASYQEGLFSFNTDKTAELCKIAELIKKYQELFIDRGWVIL